MLCCAFNRSSPTPAEHGTKPHARALPSIAGDKLDNILVGEGRTPPTVNHFRPLPDYTAAPGSVSLSRRCTVINFERVIFVRAAIKELNPISRLDARRRTGDARPASGAHLLSFANKDDEIGGAAANCQAGILKNSER